MNNRTILITGGAGYIGSHAILAFEAAGYDVVVLDDLSTGRRNAVPDRFKFFEGDAGNIELVSRAICEFGISSVAHFAGSVVVPESVITPLKYYGNNTCVSRNLISVCTSLGVKNFIFSSTAAVYGVPESIPVTETAPAAPINPYGASKIMTEWILRDCAAAHDFRYAALRYFNVAGADPDGRAGQSTPNATHLVKVACETALGHRGFIEVYGEDYDTPDGTCIRDYIHVSDLVEAHVLALEHLEGQGDNLVLNCGYGHGFSVREVLAAVEEQAGCKLDIRSAARRLGDPPQLIADNRKIRECLNWQPIYDDLNLIVKSALDWETKTSVNQ